MMKTILYKNKMRARLNGRVIHRRVECAGRLMEKFSQNTVGKESDEVFLMVWWLRLKLPMCRGCRFGPGQGAKISLTCLRVKKQNIKPEAIL